MTTCLMIGATVLHLITPVFTLGWTHSVENTGWRETWEVSEGGLELRQAAVKGSGAGMEPGDGARLESGWWIWNPALRAPSLSLAASGATVGGWTLCADGVCRDLGHVAAAPIRLAPCAAPQSAG